MPKKKDEELEKDVLQPKKDEVVKDEKKSKKAPAKKAKAKAKEEEVSALKTAEESNADEIGEDGLTDGGGPLSQDQTDFLKAHMRYHGFK